jgi:EAL domain-containing protein (putative c-di-GMP-specific phosphodiesterase class I)
VRRVVAQAATRLPFDCALFINLHPGELLDDELFSSGGVLTPFAHRCILEITERAQLDRIPDAHERIQQLRLLGYRIAIDDLGSGFAGLTSVARLEPDVVKIDLPLVRNLDRQPLCRALVRGLISSCHDLDIEVIAEGVETTAERDTLAALGGDAMQGYLFARPALGFPDPRW